jgi:hypothetical protein
MQVKLIGYVEKTYLIINIMYTHTHIFIYHHHHHCHHMLLHICVKGSYYNNNTN